MFFSGKDEIDEREPIFFSGDDAELVCLPPNGLVSGTGNASTFFSVTPPVIRFYRCLARASLDGIRILDACSECIRSSSTCMLHHLLPFHRLFYSDDLRL
ncbi:unnamed protein product [Urochloa humidicola]